MLQIDTKIQNTLKWLTMSLGVLCFAFVSYSLAILDETAIEGRLLPSYMRGSVPWKTITSEKIEAGTAVPPNVNVLLHIPKNTDDIPRKILLGHSGERVRYWGYCFPEDYEQMKTMSQRGFPGRIFLSEKERESRKEEERRLRKAKYNLYGLEQITEEGLNETEFNRGRIRHQLEIFKPGTTCYIMTEEPLPIGTDEDGDGLNSYLEKDKGSDPLVADSDGDGLSDGLEVFSLSSNPSRRDSDGDGIVDGLEDKNRNGSVDQGETDPNHIDSDRDGLCDGLCRVGSNGTETRGEDLNLNGILDLGEPSNINPDSDGDGVSDEQEYFNCKLGERGSSCDYSAFKV